MLGVNESISSHMLLVCVQQYVFIHTLCTHIYILCVTAVNVLPYVVGVVQRYIFIHTLCIHIYILRVNIVNALPYVVVVSATIYIYAYFVYTYIHTLCEYSQCLAVCHCCAFNNMYLYLLCVYMYTHFVWLQSMCCHMQLVCAQQYVTIHTLCIQIYILCLTAVNELPYVLGVRATIYIYTYIVYTCIQTLCECCQCLVTCNWWT